MAVEARTWKQEAERDQEIVLSFNTRGPHSSDSLHQMRFTYSQVTVTGSY